VKRVRVLLILLCLGSVGCQPVLEALGEGPTLEPTATSTWPPPATATPTIVPPTMPVIPTATATATRTPSPTTTPSPTVPPTPFPTPTATPTPAFGYYGDTAIGFGVHYPSDWEVEESDDGVVVRSMDPWVWVFVGSELLDEDQTVEDHVSEMYELFDDVEAVQVLTDTTVLLWDGAEARVLEFTEPGSETRARVVLRLRGRRVFFAVFAAPDDTFDDYPQTLEAIAASMRVEEPRPYGISRQNAMFRSGGQPSTLDPALTHIGSGSVIGAIFSGLVMLDRNLQVVPDLAERWQVSEDGTVYTFYLRRNATFHDGRPVTAHDVKFSWERAADPDTESDTVETYLGDIVGVNDKRRGKADEISGIEVVDDHTLQVTIDAPKVYFLAKLTCPTTFVVDEENVRDEDWEHHPNGTGPFRLLVWEDDRLLILERNDNFYAEPAKLEHVVYMLYAGVSMWMYENDEIDRVGVGTGNIERVTDPTNPLNAELHVAPSTCTSRLIFDVTVPPFDDPLVRQAFAYAIDRQKFTEVVLKGMADPAYTILPPGMPGYNDDLDAPKFDPDRAQALLASSSYGSADALPEITYTTSGWGGGLSSYDSALIDMWRTHLGVEVTVEQLEPPSFFSEVHEHHGQITSLGWCADYPDPQNFLDVLYHSESQENIGHYSNPGIDELLERARSEADVEARMALYHRIEQMIIDDAPDILLKHSINYSLIKPYVSDTAGFALGWRTVSVERPTEEVPVGAN
jgi:oligopeptide transport system substrate-binding protein